MELICTSNNQILILRIRGKLIQKNINAFKDLMLSRIKSFKHIIINMKEMTKIDHYGLDALLYIQIKALEQDCLIKLASIQPDPRVLFDITEAYKIFDIYETPDTAIENCQKEGQP